MFASSRTAFVSNSSIHQCCSSNSSNSNNNNSNVSTTILTYYSQLSGIVNTIVKLLYNFSIGNFDYVNTNLTSATYYNLSTKLLAIQQNATLYPDYENIRLSITNSLQGLQQAMTLYNSLQSAESQLAMTKARAGILDNMDQLRAYISSLGGAMSIFQDVTVTSVAAALKPEIAIYIKLYGYPPGGVFEMDKLANAIELANIQSSVPAP